MLLLLAIVTAAIVIADYIITRKVLARGGRELNPMGKTKTGRLVLTLVSLLGIAAIYWGGQRYGTYATVAFAWLIVWRGYFVVRGLRHLS